MDSNQAQQQRVPLMRRFGAIFGVMGFFTALFFQNCDGGFHYDPKSGELTSQGIGSSAFRLTTFNSSGLVVPEGQSFDGGVEYKVVSSGQNISNATLMWQLIGNTGNCVLKAGTGPEVRYVQCDKSGRVSVQASAIWPDGSTSVLASERTTGELIVDACGPSGGTRSVFRIPAGTGNNAWNSSASPLIVYVGQVLRICNDDSVSHQLHTGGAPCAHQSDPGIGNGGYYDCRIANMNNLNAATGLYNDLYDHLKGTNAAFYVQPYDGGALYADGTKSSTGESCATCHNALANSTRKGRSATAIRAAINGNAGGVMGVFQGRITDEELRAIAFSLSL